MGNTRSENDGQMVGLTYLCEQTLDRILETVIPHVLDLPYIPGMTIKPCWLVVWNMNSIITTIII